jgi:ketosteroid isomerase-like protein
MTYLSEDPTYLAGGFLLLGAAFVIALKATQQGKYLIGAATAMALAFLVVVVEWVWVTENERIEKVVYEVRAAVLKSDADGVLAHLAPNVMYLQGDTALMSDDTRALIRKNVSDVHLEFARITELRTSIGQQTRRGIAEFRVFTRGGLKSWSHVSDGMTSMTAWSLGFQETEPGVWKIYRISPVSIPSGVLALPGGVTPSDGSHIGLSDAIGVPRSGAQSFPQGHNRPRRIPGVNTRTN